MTMTTVYFVLITILVYIISQFLGNFTDRHVKDYKTAIILYVVCIALNLVGIVTAVSSIIMLIRAL